jgi:RNase P/RNase MRP subunit POP5
MEGKKRWGEKRRERNRYWCFFTYSEEEEEEKEVEEEISLLLNKGIQAFYCDALATDLPTDN